MYANTWDFYVNIKYSGSHVFYDSNTINVGTCCANNSFLLFSNFVVTANDILQVPDPPHCGEYQPPNSWEHPTTLKCLWLKIDSNSRNALKPLPVLTLSPPQTENPGGLPEHVGILKLEATWLLFHSYPYQRFNTMRIIYFLAIQIQMGDKYIITN